MTRLKVAVSITLPHDLMIDIGNIQKELRMNRSETIAWLLQKGIYHWEQMVLTQTGQK